MELLGVKIDNFSLIEVLQKIQGFLVDGGQHQIATVNPEFIVLAQGVSGNFKSGGFECGRWVWHCFGSAADGEKNNEGGRSRFNRKPSAALRK